MSVSGIGPSIPVGYGEAVADRKVAAGAGEKVKIRGNMVAPGGIANGNYEGTVLDMKDSPREEIGIVASRNGIFMEGAAGTAY